MSYAEGVGLINMEAKLLQGVCASAKEAKNRLNVCWFPTMPM